MEISCFNESVKDPAACSAIKDVENIGMICGGDVTAFSVNVIVTIRLLWRSPKLRNYEKNLRY